MLSSLEATEVCILIPMLGRHITSSAFLGDSYSARDLGPTSVLGTSCIFTRQFAHLHGYLTHIADGENNDELELEHWRRVNSNTGRVGVWPRVALGPLLPAMPIPFQSHDKLLGKKSARACILPSGVTNMLPIYGKSFTGRVGPVMMRSQKCTHLRLRHRPVKIVSGHPQLRDLDRDLGKDNFKDSCQRIPA
jgi:hypothetical protein